MVSIRKAELNEEIAEIRPKSVTLKDLMKKLPELRKKLQCKSCLESTYTEAAKSLKTLKTQCSEKSIKKGIELILIKLLHKSDVRFIVSELWPQDIWVDNRSYNKLFRVAPPPELHSDHAGLEVEGRHMTLTDRYN